MTSALPCLCDADLVQSCVLFQLLLFLGCRCKDDADADGVKADKKEARRLIDDKVLPIIQKLLRSFDPATVGAVTGNNALHEICTLLNLGSVANRSYKLFELLVDRGVSVHARNKKGRTPLLQRAAGSTPARFRSNDGMRLLLSRGADLNAQDNYGNGVLHHLIRRQAESSLEDLLGGGGVAHLDYALRNGAGQTAVDFAAMRVEEQTGSSSASPAKRIHRMMMTQTALWTKHTRPLLLRCLESALPVTDVAKLALGYIDGSGLPFVTAAEEGESDEQAEPAAAAAAATQS